MKVQVNNMHMISAHAVLALTMALALTAMPVFADVDGASTVIFGVS